jgi:glycosyltransferase involved in cell wall biosynthesis
MKKILIVTTIEATVKGFLIPHIKHLQAQGHDIEVATNLSKDSSLQKDLPNVNLHDIPFSRSVTSYKNLIALRHIKKLLTHTPYDLIHVHTPIASFLTRFANRKKNIPLIYTAHGFHFNEQGSKLQNFIFRYLERLAGKWLDKLIVINAEDYKQAVEIVTPTKVTHVKGIGIDENYYSPLTISTKMIQNLKKANNFPLDKKIIIHIAEFNENKRQIDIVEAAGTLKKKRNDFHFFLVGEGDSLLDIKQAITKYNVNEEVSCLGFRKDIKELLAISDIGLNVSLREGLPRSVMEMMAMNLPVIATNIRGNRDLVINGSTGVLIPVKDSEALANACASLLDNLMDRRLYGQQGRKCIMQEYSLANVLREIDQVYKEFL